MYSDFRALPSVNVILAHDSIAELVRSYSHTAVVSLIREKLKEIRHEIECGNPPPTMADILDTIRQEATIAWQPWPHPVINATGVILHTNLGRAPLSPEAVQAITRASQGYSNLEFDLQVGKRGSRQAYLSFLLAQLTGAQAGLVVNNNASAVMLGLAAVGNFGEVVVSRGEAVEIGGGFRIPQVLQQSGVSLVEVGTTNRTYVSDYEAAITENTAALLAVHASNFHISGFTHKPRIQELVELGLRHKIPVLHDLGSGCLLETTQFGLVHEPMPQESISAGCGLAFFSGDKLLGGPQAGIVVGQKDLIHRLEHHPLARAIRLDKLSLAGLSATILHYLKNEAISTIPIWRMIATPAAELKRRANQWKNTVGPRAKVIRGKSTIGGGSLPGETLPTWVVALGELNPNTNVENLSAKLRQVNPAVVGRIEYNRILLDPRTVLPEEDKVMVRSLKESLL